MGVVAIALPVVIPVTGVSATGQTSQANVWSAVVTGQTNVWSAVATSQNANYQRIAA